MVKDNPDEIKKEDKDMETSEEVKEEMEEGTRDEEVYSEEGREKLEEDDEISPEEAGFMEGAEGLGQDAKDALTGEPLMDDDRVFEREINGKRYRFASEENADKFAKKLEKEKKE